MVPNSVIIQGITIAGKITRLLCPKVGHFLFKSPGNVRSPEIGEPGNHKTAASDQN